MTINYLRPSKSSGKKSRQEIEGVYRCAKCLMIFPSDIKYKRHDCYCEHEFESYEKEMAG
jgi:hypothetical protein